MRFYRMSETAWAQIQAVGMSIQVGSTIVGVAPSSWWGKRGVAKSPRLFSRLAIKLLAADYNNGRRTAFGIDIGSMRLTLKTKGAYRNMDTSESVGWDFWRHSPRAAP